MQILKIWSEEDEIKKLTQANSLRECKTNEKAPNLSHTEVQSYFRDSWLVFL